MAKAKASIHIAQNKARVGPLPYFYQENRMDRKYEVTDNVVPGAAGKIHRIGDCSYKIKRCKQFGIKKITQLGKMFNVQGCYTSNKDTLLFNVSSVVRYGSQSWRK